MNAGYVKVASHAIQQAYNSSDEETKVIIEHDCIAGALALIPIPYADMIGMAGNQIALYGRLNEKLGIRMSKSFLKVIAGFMISQITGIISVVPVAVGGKVIGGLLKIVPGLGTVAGIVVDAGCNATLTHILGVVYLVSIKKMVASGANVEDVESVKAALKEQLADKDLIKKAYKEAKNARKNMNFDEYKSKAEEMSKQ